MDGDSEVRERAGRSTANIRVALGAAFALVIGLWLASGYLIARNFAELEHDVARAHAGYLSTEHKLSTLRSDVLLGSIYVRDAIIDDTEHRQESYGRELSRMADEVRAILAESAKETMPAVERAHWLRLESEMQAYWATRELAVASSDTEAARLLRRQIVPKRQAVLQILDQLSALQKAAYAKQQKEIRDLYSQIEQRLASMGALTLLVALVIATIAAIRILRQQRVVERQQLAERQAHEDLERLSARIVDAQEEERRNLARELHDEVGQALSAVKMDIGVALRAPQLDPRAKIALEEAREITETTLRGVRDLSQLLHPSALDDFGLPATLSAYLQSFTRRTGIRAQLAEMIDRRLGAEIEVCVYRVVQEALNNVAQHSGATTCSIALLERDDVLRLMIEDNGCGLRNSPDPANARRGLGLVGIRERAQALGGSFELEEAGQGLRLMLTLPMASDLAEPAKDHTQPA